MVQTFITTFRTASLSECRLLNSQSLYVVCGSNMNKNMSFRWQRTFSTASTLADDLGGLGCWVGPRLGPVRRDHGQMEDYVLRRILVALRRQNKLLFPFDVFASHETPGQPDFIIADASGEWGIEVTQGGSKAWQKQLTQLEKQPDSVKLSRPPKREVSTKEIRDAIANKINKVLKDGAYQDVAACDLAIYNNTDSFDVNKKLVDGVIDPSLCGVFRQVYIVASSGRVFTDVLSNQPLLENITGEHDIVIAERIADKVDRSIDDNSTRRDVDILIDKLSRTLR